jgi:hypothetical protein
MALPTDGPSPLYDPSADAKLRKQLAEVASQVEGRTLGFRLLGVDKATARPRRKGAPPAGEIGKSIEEQWPGAERVDF